MENEIWLPVKNFEPRFIVSNYGRIISIGGKYGGRKLLNPHLSKLGYYETQLRMKPIQRRVRVHVLVAETFLVKPNIENVCVNHKDGNKLNNHVSNLEWITLGENIKHAVTNGLMNNKGENHKMSKLTKSKVIEIRQMRKNGLSHKEISDIVGISRRHIGDILNGVCWGWLN